MRSQAIACLVLVALNCAAAYPVMRTVKGDGPAVKLLHNGAFEGTVEGRPESWAAAPNGCERQATGGRKGSAGLRCANTNASNWAGASQTLILNRTNTSPLAVRGWSKAENISGTPDSGYSLYVDIIYTDGTPLWGQTANFRCGTHDWQQQEFLVFPQKPIRTLTIHCILRGHSGVAWFDDIRVDELTTKAGTVIFDGVPVTLERRDPSPNTSGGSPVSSTYKTRDGLELRLEDSKAALLGIRGSEATGAATSGFLVRDAAANSDVYGFENGDCVDLNLKLQVECVAEKDHISLHGRVSDTSGKDRAVTLYFALPVDASGWRWGDDVRRDRVMNDRTEFSKTVGVGCGATGRMSLYPVAAIWNERDGLGLGLDMDHAAQFRIACNGGTRQLIIAYDFGLTPETKRFPAAAEFSFVVFRFEPEWGFRAAFEKYVRIFPEHFRVRSRDQGIWMPFTDVSTVEGWEDFGFKYHEGINNVPWDDAHGILSFRYTEPMTWWMAMAKEVPRTLAEAVRVRDALARGTPGRQGNMAKVTQVAGMSDEADDPAISFRDTPWCNGAVWSINPNPHLPVPEASQYGDGRSSYNGATIYWNNSIKEELYGPGAKAQQDGEYLDSLEGYVTAELNFKREHFRYTTVPLSFARDTRRPALFKGLAVYEFTKWLSGEVHRLDKLMFANGVPYRISFLCPWLDVMGTETDWLRGGQYAPASDEQMSLWRTLSGKKPYLLLMNTDYSVFNPPLVEKYFQRSLFYGMFPSMFSHNAADNPYWSNANWYNRDRMLFKKYIPLVKRLSIAGWEPVTLARCDNPSIYLERFGPDSGKTSYITLLNDTAEIQAGLISIDLRAIGANEGFKARELIAGAEFNLRDPLRVSLQPQGAAVLEITP